MKIIMNVPSIYPERFKKMYDSFKAMTRLQDIIKVHLVAQSPWNEDELVDINPDYSSLVERKSIPHMTNIRLHSLQSYSDYIMFADDDLIFKRGAEEYLIKVIEVLTMHKPDVLNVFGSRYDGNFIYNPDKCIIGTNRGLFVKTEALRDNVWLDQVLCLQGGLEESVIAYKALEHSGKLIVVGNAPIDRTHKHTPSAGNDSPIHDTLIWQDNAQKFIRERYDDPNWTHDSGNFPKGLNYMTSALEKQIGGDHYSKLKIQPVEYCFHNNIPAIEAGVIKYVTRHKDKGGAYDIKKAIHLLEILLKLEYGE